MNQEECVATKHLDLWIALAFHLLTLFLMYGFCVAGMDLDLPIQQDVTRYYEYSRKVAGGMWPYADFSFEYPPLALLPMVVPLIVTVGCAVHYPTYLHVFALQNCLISAFIMIMLAALMRKAYPKRAVMPFLFAYMVNLLILSPLLFWRYDIFPAAISVICLYAILNKRPLLAGTMIGLGIAAKLYSVVFLPVLLAYYTAKQEWRKMIFVLCAAASVVGIILLPFLLVGQADLVAFLRYHQERGIQLESVAAGVVIALDAAGIAESAVNYSHGAWHVVSPLADRLLVLLPIAFVLTMCAVAFCCHLQFRAGSRLHVRAGESDLYAYLAMSLLVLLTFGNVFSPQFLIWLMPFTVLLPGSQSLIVTVISLMTMVMVTPWIYPQLIELKLPAILLLNSRNAFVVLLFLVLLKRAVSNEKRRAPG